MSTFPNSPRLLKAGLVLVDAQSGQVQRILSLQYNPDSLTRSFQVQALGGDGQAERSDVLRLRGPAVESYKLDAELDATDQLELPDQNDSTVRHGLQPQLAALELMLHPSVAQLNANDVLANAGVLEILPMQAPLCLFVWGQSRVVPVRITEFSITEEAFDPALNPIRAKVSLGMRVLSVDDLGFRHRGGTAFMSYLRVKEQLARAASAGSFTTLGIGGVP